jgi:hypothetical protein
MAAILLLGIDPGTTGAAALYNPSLSKWTVIDLPQCDHGLHVAKFRDWVKVLSPTVCYIEHVTPNPKFGLVASTRLIKAAAQARTVVECIDIPTVGVTAPVWKRALGLLKADKHASLELARDMFPEAADEYIQFKKHHNRAEAMLIAWYGSRQFGTLFRQYALL